MTHDETMEAELRRIERQFGLPPRVIPPRDPSDDAIDPNDTTRNPPRDTDE